MKSIIYHNKKYLSQSKVVVKLNDLGFVRGYGVFEAMKTIKGKPFLLEEHFTRLQQSADILDIQMPIDLVTFQDVIWQLLVKNQVIKLNSFFVKTDVLIKVILTGGVSSDGLLMDGEPTFIIFLDDLQKVKPEQNIIKNGGKLISINFQRFLPEVKTMNYIIAIKNQKLKINRGATEILYHDQGKVRECSTSNIFMVKGSQIITPQKNILLGTTRNFLISLLKKEKISVQEREVSLEELYLADEVFVTGTFKDVLPICQIDDKIIGSGKIGKQTRLCQKIFKSGQFEYLNL